MIEDYESEGEFEYEIALSFAGEDRKIAEEIANGLIIDGVKVFYDRFYKTEMWGKKLTHYFQDVYGPKARFVIVLISKYYPIKDWTDFEFFIARGEAKKRKEEFILPLTLDDTKILGIHEDVGYLDLEKEGVEGVVDAVREKLNIKERSISKGIFITTLGVNFEDLVEKGILSEKDLGEYPKTCDKLEDDLRARLDKSSIGEYYFTESSARKGETLSVRFAHYWDLSEGVPDFSFTDYWDLLEFRPVEEIYPESHKEVRSMFGENIPEEGKDRFRWLKDVSEKYMDSVGITEGRITLYGESIYNETTKLTNAAEEILAMSLFDVLSIELKNYYFNKYLETNLNAVKRGIKIKRIFLIPKNNYHVIEHIVSMQREAGIETMVLYIEEVPQELQDDFVIFDKKIVSYVSAPLTANAHSLKSATISVNKRDLRNYIRIFDETCNLYNLLHKG